MAEDFTNLTTSLTALHDQVAQSAANMDKLFSDLQAALASGNQAAVDQATAAVQAEIDILKSATAKDLAP